ncbi:MAG: SDR family NAD(P)-dependent oxidoreductase [Thermoplasmatota archaeon]
MAETVSREPIAIIGVGCVLPDAPDVDSFWKNLVSGRSSIREVPKERWDADLFWSEDRLAPDRTYAKIGAFVSDDAFAPIDFRIMPSVLQQIDPSQRWALSATRQALRDAGLKTGIKGDEGRDFDRTRTAVILGNAMGGELMKLHTKRLYWPQVDAALKGDPDFGRLPAAEQKAILERTKARYHADVPPITEDSMPGTLANVAAGRIANAFDLSGKNFTTDAACASSLAALDSAVDCLRKGECDLVVWGGTDRSMDVTPFVEFSKIGALSADGSRPFDAGANGFVMGEGCAMFVLKRLSDAERDKNHVYAVVRGLGGSSDGKGKGITAPNPVGQVKAVTRAYVDAEVDPSTLGYLEAHGTSTPVGDPVELQAAIEAFKGLTKAPLPPGLIPVGSVKGNMGHLKSAAGAVAMLKVALALDREVIPPSINVHTLNPRIDWKSAPFRVQTEAAPWPRGALPRRAGVSSFGFGGTNFHVVVEEYSPGQLKVRSQPVAAMTHPTLDLGAFQAAMKEAAALEAEPLVLDAAGALATLSTLPKSLSFSQTGEGPRLRDVLHPFTAAGITAERRVAFSVAQPEEVAKKLDQAQKAASDPAKARLAFQQGVFMGTGKPRGKVAFLFPGQGTQYVNMLRDLAGKYEVVRNTFEEADQILIDELDGVKLTDILWPKPNTPEAQAGAERRLQLTEFTQPAVLAADVALLRLLRQWGVEPDVVAGHSLGEYGALVAAGVLSFADALHAVAARGREMAHVEVPDLGKMASVNGDWHAVTEAIRAVGEYVIPANKNSPSQTVIAGSSAGVDQAVALLQGGGFAVQLLPVSAAFHSEIVAPASKPLRMVLSRLDVKAPRVRVLSNVGAQPLPDDVEWIRDNLAAQVASPVEWIGIVERMYREGVRIFVEVGPKLALTNFVRDILKGEPDAIAIGSNHPKKGGIAHVNELFAFLGAWGFEPRLPALADPSVYTATHRDPTHAMQTRAAPDRFAELEGRLDRLTRDLASLQGSLDGRSLAPPPSEAPRAATVVTPAASGGDAERLRRLDAWGINLDDIAITGVSVGLPGRGKKLFADDNWDRILNGENLIDVVTPKDRQAMADKNIVRLVKDGSGAAHFQAVSDASQVIHLAGQRGGFDVADYGIGADLADALDRSYQYAIAAGIEALRDAGIPLQRGYAQTTTGGWLPKEWRLPESLRDGTGVVFAAAFPGMDSLVRDVSRGLAARWSQKSHAERKKLYADLLAVVTNPDDRRRLQEALDEDWSRVGAGPEAHYEFNRKFLFNVLSMGHSQLAQFIGARGPNTQVNAACASTTQALAVAEDWIRTGRAKRVVVIGADDITSETLFEWFGAGFLAAGAATTKGRVEDAALPFDRRRHGMIVGMGAVGLVVETESEVQKRGMRPIARLLATRVSNSAFHGSRLDVDHIASEMRAMLEQAHRRYGIVPAAIAKETVFMSHETYTPARGGSASAEIHALRATFGAAANQVVIANTKGFTGHPQGASIEDAIVLKCLQRGIVPPIANFRDPDPELGDLNLSRGGRYNLRYGLRISAGFGSQIAMCLTELQARENERTPRPAEYAAWLTAISGLSSPRLEVQNRALRIVDEGRPKAPVVVAAAPARAAPAGVLPRLISLVAEKTGYPLDLLDPDQDMEADLGIDTVKQAELFGALRDLYALPAEEGIQIKDYPTLRKVAGYVEGRLGGATSHPAPPAAAAAPQAPAGGVLERLIALVAQKTGYPLDLLDPDQDMEADLGIDTVKQAELFGALRDLYALPAEEGIQIKDYPTLRKVAGYVEGRLSNGGHAPPATPQAPRPAAPAVTEGRTAALRHDAPAQHATPAKAAATGTPPSSDVLATVIALVAAKTGYPPEMLEPDQDMEADLGIDTVKQAELFGEVRATFGIPPVDGLQLKEYPTLRKVAGFVQAHLPAGAPTNGSSAGNPGSLLGSVPPGHAPPVVQVREIPAPPHVPGRSPKGRTIVLDDHPLVAELAKPTAQVAREASQPPENLPPFPVAATATIRRLQPVVRAESSPKADNQVRRGTVLVVGDADTQYVEALAKAGFHPTYRLREGGPVAGIVALATRKGTAALERSLALFDAAKRHRADMVAGEGTPFIVAVTAQDGAHGLDHVRDASMAAVGGVAKSLRKEFPAALVKAVDVHPDTPGGPNLVLQELLTGGPRTEVAFNAQGVRHVVDLVPAPLPDAVPDVRGQVILVSGGAQGITAEILAALAPQKPRLALLGRTPLPPDAERWATWQDAQWKSAEGEAAAALKARGERATPVAIQKEVAPMRKAAEVQRNLVRLRSLGAEAIYVAADVASTAAVKGALQRIHSEWGQGVDGVLHAAGVEISKDISAKDRAQFAQVFAAKADGWDALMAALAKDRVQFLVAFGSVAGRFGNLGQPDYAAANEYLTKAVKAEAVRRGIGRAMTIAWGPWADVGMATRGSIMQVLAAAGVTAIPTQEGVAMFLRELAAEGVRESVVAGALGAIDGDSQARPVAATPPPREPAPAARATAAPEERLLEDIVEQQAKRVVAHVRLDQARDAFARDHRVDGVPYLPGVFGIEAFAEAGHRLAGSQELLSAFDIQFASPLKQLKSQPVTATLEADVAATHAGTTEVACRLTTQFVGPDGKPHGEPRLHFSGRLMFGTPTGAPKGPPPPLCTQEKVAAAIYPPFFHGPSFQVLRSAGPLDMPAVGLYRHPVEAPFAAGGATFQSLPMLVEALFQLCGLRTLEQERVMCLPASLERLEILHHAALPDQVTLVAHAEGRDGSLRVFNAEAVGPDGRVLVRVTGFRMVPTSPEPAPAPPAAAVPIPDAPAALPQIDDVLFAAVAVEEGAAAERHWFTPAEVAAHANFKVPKRAAEWRAGRLAAKRAVQLADAHVGPLEVEVIGDPETRAPKLRVKGRETALCISITHRDGLAVAAVSPQPLGVDLETLEERPASFAAEALSPAEAATVAKAADPKVDITCIWAAKEAALKRAGTGLKADLRAHTVKADAHGGAVVEGPTGRFGVRFFEVAGKVLAVSIPPFDK